MPKAITSLEGYIRKIAALSAGNPIGSMVFRGHSKVEYTVQPSIYRSKNHEESEHLMIRQLLGQQPHEFKDDRGIFDQLVRAQHYGLPTRLLDVTLNPLAALYFAVNSNASKRAAVIVFKPATAKQRYFDSDTVSLLSALSLLTKGEKDRIRGHSAAAFKARADKSSNRLKKSEIENYNNNADIEKLIQLVRSEKPDFRPIVQPADLALPVFVTPRKLHSRIISQNGAFIIFGLGRLGTSNQLKDIPREEIHISPDSKSRIIAELGQVGITESALFPEIEKAAGAIKRRYD